MTRRDLDSMLDEALRTGQIPLSATDAQRIELEQLLRAAQRTNDLRSAVEAEAARSLPVARARFQRHLATPAQPAAAGPRPGFLSRFIGHRGLALVASAAAIGVIAVAASFAYRSLEGEDTASALTLNENDFAQVEGVVSATSGNAPGQTVTIQSDFGEIQVALTDSTLVGGSGSGTGPARLNPGDVVTIAGTVGKRAKATSISAVSVAVAAKSGRADVAPKLRELRTLEAAIEGRISVVTVSGDGTKARVIVDTGAEHVIVRVGAESLRWLLEGGGSPIGRQVRVEAGKTAGEFSLVMLKEGGSPAAEIPARPALATVRGLMTSRNANVVRIQTERGPVSVLVGPKTRIVAPKAAGITIADVRKGNAVIGHELTVVGVLDAATGRIAAEVLVVGARPSP